MELTAKNVNDVFMKCLFEDGEPTEGFVEAFGVITRVGFHPGRLEENRENIRSMLDSLPKEFKIREGGGMSFLNACNDKDGNQWTDLHKTIDELLCLGLATKLAKYVLPDREKWKIFPGGMPYFTVN